MRGDESHRLRMIAMRQRHARIGRARERRGDARNHFEGDAVRAQEFEFLAAASEHERIAALQAHDAPARARMFDA